MNSFSIFNILPILTIIMLLANPLSLHALPLEHTEQQHLNPLKVHTIHGMDLQDDTITTGSRYPLVGHSPDRLTPEAWELYYDSYPYES